MNFIAPGSLIILNYTVMGTDHPLLYSEHSNKVQNIVLIVTVMSFIRLNIKRSKTLNITGASVGLVIRIIL